MSDDISKIVDEFIHETYLMSLSERELLQHLEDFSDICGKAIADTIRDSLELVKLNNKLSVIRANQLAETSELENKAARGNVTETDMAIIKVRQIMKNKALILDAIEEVAPDAAVIIRKEIDPERRRNLSRKRNKLLKSIEKVSITEHAPVVRRTDSSPSRGMEKFIESRSAKLPLLIFSSTLLFAAFFIGTLLIAKGF